jgi:hypothetical protein
MTSLSVSAHAEDRAHRAPTATTEGVVTGTPRVTLRLEGVIVLVAASVVYAQVGSGWVVFALLFLVPDLSMLGYLGGSRIGAVTYNLGHSYILPTALGALGVVLSQHFLLALGLIWLAHIGFDRALGYGLKYGTAFGRTHLGLVGKLKAQT